MNTQVRIAWLPYPLHRLDNGTLNHADQFASLEALAQVLEEFPVDLAARFAGGKPEQILALAGILPFFSLFSSIYFRSVTQGKKSIRVYKRRGKSKETDEEYLQNKVKSDDEGLDVEPNKINSGGIPKIGGWEGRDRWYVEWEKYNTQYQAFRSELVVNFRETGKDDRNDWNKTSVIEWMNAHHLGEETAKRFYRYFSGVSKTSGKVKTRPIKDSCAWPLGCVQNLPHEESPYASSLCQEVEHSRPKIYDPTVAGDQYMCRIHNQWKTSNPMLDLGGILWCIYGD